MGGGLVSAGEQAVDNGDGKGVGGVVGLGDGGESEMELDHGLDLGFVGLAVAADGFFDLVGSIFVDGEVVLFGDQETDAAGFGDKSTIAISIKSAVIMTSTLPIIILYPFLQKYFVKGLTVGSVKG